MPCQLEIALGFYPLFVYLNLVLNLFKTILYCFNYNERAIYTAYYESFIVDIVMGLFS